MTASNRSLLAIALLVFGTVLSSTLLIPALRPFVALRAPGSESAAHAFMALGLLGAVLAAPFVARLLRLSKNTARVVAALALLDAALLAWLAAETRLTVLFALRLAQGALNLALLSMLLGAAPVGDRRHSGSRYGALGAAMMLAVAAGAPFGTLCLRLGPTAPLYAGAALELLVAALVPVVGLQQPERRAGRPPLASLPWLPMAWVFAERMAIGLFVVTFAFHARQCLGASDTAVGLAITAFMAPFVMTVYPAGRLSDQLGAVPVAVAGLALYGFGWVALSAASEQSMLPVLLLLGVASALVFAAALRESATGADVESRVRAMSALNSAGSLGMLLGTALAGVISAVLRARGAHVHVAHGLTFGVAGGLQLAAALATAAVVFVRARNVRLVRN